MSPILFDQLALVIKLILADENTVIKTGYSSYLAHYVAEHERAAATADAALAQAAAA